MLPGYRGTFVAFVAAVTLSATHVPVAGQRRGRGDDAERPSTCAF